MDKKRVVVTGIGAVSPIGNNMKENWEAIKNSVCGINHITKFDVSNYRTKVDAEVKNLNFEDYFDSKFIKHSDASTMFAVIAAREAFKDSNLSKDNIDMNRVGSYISTGIGGVNVLQEQSIVFKEKGNRRVSPMLIPITPMPSLRKRIRPRRHRPPRLLQMRRLLRPLRPLPIRLPPKLRRQQAIHLYSDISTKAASTMYSARMRLRSKTVTSPSRSLSKTALSRTLSKLRASPSAIHRLLILP